MLIYQRNCITHLVSDEIQLTVFTRHTGKGTLLLVKLKEHPEHIVRKLIHNAAVWFSYEKYSSESTLPLSPHKQSRPHSPDRTQVSSCTPQFCAPLGGSLSQTVGTVGKARWQTDTVPGDSGRRRRNNAVNVEGQQWLPYHGLHQRKMLFFT